VRAIELIWCEEGIEFKDAADGGFRLRVEGDQIVGRPKPREERHKRGQPRYAGK
jgi:RNase P/RNase MRP subunit p29